MNHFGQRQFTGMQRKAPSRDRRPPDCARACNPGCCCYEQPLFRVSARVSTRHDGLGSDHAAAFAGGRGSPRLRSSSTARSRRPCLTFRLLRLVISLCQSRCFSSRQSQSMVAASSSTVTLVRAKSRASSAVPLSPELAVSLLLPSCAGRELKNTVHRAIALPPLVILLDHPKCLRVRCRIVDVPGVRSVVVILIPETAVQPEPVEQIDGLLQAHATYDLVSSSCDHRRYDIVPFDDVLLTWVLSHVLDPFVVEIVTRKLFSLPQCQDDLRYFRDFSRTSRAQNMQLLCALSSSPPICV